MINSKNINDLHPIIKKMAEDMVKKLSDQGINIIITSTYRDNESQNELYSHGRTKPGMKITNAKGGQSFHNYRVAFDVVPVVNNKAVWNDTKLWNKIGKVGIECGLFWGKNWKSFSECPHFQYTGRITDYKEGIKYFLNGGKLENLI